MPVFQYDATDAQGVAITAEITAVDALAAVEALRAKGLAVTRIVQTASVDSGSDEHMLSPQSIGRPPDRPTTCGWCQTQVPPPVTVTNCPNCGGTLPLPPGPDRGPPPPVTPRPIPRAFEHKLKYGALFWFGSAVALIGLLISVSTLGFSLIFTGVGGLMVRQSWTTATNRIAALKSGATGEGEVTFVGYDETLTVNGKHPYLIRYRWEHDGRYCQGQKSTWDATALDHFPGEPLWVVYVPEDTRKSAIWPPLA